MKARSKHRFDVYPSEALKEKLFDFSFYRSDLLRTSQLFQSAQEKDDDEQLGKMTLKLTRVNAGLYIAKMDFVLNIPMRCCYCLQLLQCTIADDIQVELKTDTSAGSYQFTDNQAFDCRELFEEEILLRAPMNPHHESCTLDNASATEVSSFVTMGAISGDNQGRGAATWRPFANIRSLVDS